MLSRDDLNWTDLIGNEDVWNRLIALQSKSSAHVPQVILFAGRAGIGKRLFMAKMAALWACESNRACGYCGSCKRVQQYEHEDLLWIDPAGMIKSEDASQVKDHLALHAVDLNFSGQNVSMPRIVVIADIERLNASAANRLLKILEEPPAGSFIFMSTSGLRYVMDTIRSRAVTIRLRAPRFEDSLALLRRKLDTLPEASKEKKLSDADLTEILWRHSQAPGAALSALEDALSANLSGHLDQLAEKLLEARSYPDVMELGLQIAKSHSISAADFCERMEVVLNRKYRSMLGQEYGLKQAYSEPVSQSKLRMWRRSLSEARNAAIGKGVPLNSQLLADVFGMIAISE